MNRITRNLGLLSAALLLVPASAQAITVSLDDVQHTGTGTATVLEFGDTLTFFGTFSNAAAVDVYGLGLAVDGYDSDDNGLADNGLVFVDGDVVDSVFNIFNDGTTAFGGLSNQISDATEIGYYNPFCALTGCPVIDPLRVQIFNGVSTNSGINGTGQLDNGINDIQISQGDYHFAVTFRATGGTTLNNLTLTFGEIPSQGEIAVGDGGATIPVTNASYSFAVVPEPGTALLMGLGLAGLAGVRRR